MVQKRKQPDDALEGQDIDQETTANAGLNGKERRKANKKLKLEAKAAQRPKSQKERPPRSQKPKPALTEGQKEPSTQELQASVDTQVSTEINDSIVEAKKSRKRRKPKERTTAVQTEDSTKNVSNDQQTLKEAPLSANSQEIPEQQVTTATPEPVGISKRELKRRRREARAAAEAQSPAGDDASEEVLQDAGRVSDKLDDSKRLEILPDAETPNASSKKKRQKRRDKKGQNGDRQDGEATTQQNASVTTIALAHKKSNGVSDNSHGKSAEKHVKASDAKQENALVLANPKRAWTVSEPSAGQFLNLKPVFSLDGENVIIATQTSIHIYSTRTSLLVNTLAHDPESTITAYLMSPADASVLFTTSRSGRVVVWKWREAKMLHEFEGASPCRGADIALSADGSVVLYTIEESSRSRIVARMFSKDSYEIVSRTTILSHDKAITMLQAVPDSNIVIGMTQIGLVIGRAEHPGQMTFTWREIKCSEAPTSFAARVTQGPVLGGEVKGTKQKAATIDVAVGGAKGCIYVYENLAAKLGLTGRSSKATNEALSPAVRELHWHREAVGTVAWSLDGNYVISGGLETVLVLWQLETGKKQFLPNLESPIQNLTVSPSGSSYAVHLADNSMMVLSTSELQPTANVAGLQSSIYSGITDTASPAVSTVDTKAKPARVEEDSFIQAVLHPQTSGLLLAAVPGYQTAREASTKQYPAPYLQTFDLHTSRQISRQALTRTSATTTNLGPEGNRIRTPNVNRVQITPNGRWLVTVDEWTPPRQDFEDLIVDEQDVSQEVERHSEVHLKFWSWNADEAIWALNTRIEAPHQLQNSRASGRVLDMAVDPAGTHVATLGEDSVVRIWAPKTRTADGRILRGEGNAKLPVSGSINTWWTISHAIPLEKAMAESPLTSLRPQRGRLAYSNDGTALAAYQYFGASADASTTPVHFIDADAGQLRASRTGMHPAPTPAHPDDGVHALAFLERRLVLVGRHAASVWDVTTTTLVATLALAEPSPRSLALPAPLLAVDTATNTFAISTTTAATPADAADNPRPLRPRDLSARLRIFDPATPQTPLLDAHLPRPIRALLAATAPGGPPAQADASRRGYVVIDAAASVRTLVPGGAGFGRTPARAEAEAEAEAEADADMADADEDASSDAEMITDADADADADAGVDDAVAPLRLEPAPRRVVRPEQLARLFEYPSHALPGMRELLAGVVGLYAGRDA